MHDRKGKEAGRKRLHEGSIYGCGCVWLCVGGVDFCDRRDPEIQGKKEREGKEKEKYAEAWYGGRFGRLKD